MCPEFSLFSLTIPAYSVMVGLGILVAGLVRILLPVKRGFTSQGRDFVVIPAVIGLIVGAKLPVVISYGAGPEMLTSGRSLLGALMGAYLCVRLAKRLRGATWTGGGDAYVLPVAMGLVFGRLACLFHGCCWGINGFPAPLLEMAFHLVMFGVFFVLRRKNLLVGTWFPLYMTAYCAFRFGSEFIRTEPRIALGLTIYQYMALAGLVIFPVEIHLRAGKSAGVIDEPAVN